MKKNVELPVVEKGVPIPTVKSGDMRNVPKSLWPAFLQALVAGDSFVLFYPSVYNVTAIAKRMGIPLKKFDLPKEPGDKMAKARIWRLPDEQVVCGGCGSIQVRTERDFCHCGGRLVERQTDLWRLSAEDDDRDCP